MAIHDDRWLTYPWGVNGRYAGRPQHKTYGARGWFGGVAASKCDNIEVKEGDILYFNTWGGGGWGDPFKREAALVARDVDRGLVSMDGAKRYGVVLKADGSLDENATTDLRDKLSKERGDPELFDFGGTIEELKARCKAETSFDPRFNRFSTGVCFRAFREGCGAVGNRCPAFEPGLSNVAPQIDCGATFFLNGRPREGPHGQR